MEHPLICKPCAKAGDAATAGLEENIVALQHNECEAPDTCPCHHEASIYIPE